MPENKPPEKKGGKGKILGLPYWAVGAALVVAILGYVILSKRSSQAAPPPQAPAPDPSSNQSASPYPSTGGGSSGGASLPSGINDSMYSMLSGLGMDPNLAGVGASQSSPGSTNIPGEGNKPEKQQKRAYNRAHGIQDKPPYTNSKYQPGGIYYKTGLGRDPKTGNTYASDPNWKG